MSQPPAHVYNAENQMTSYTNGATTTTYSYDGDGRRVEKSGGKIYWYGGGSDALDETDLSGNTNNSTFSEYLFFDGSRMVRRDYQANIFYYSQNQLGTSREMLQSGQTSPCYDGDFYPFGGERAYTTTCTQNYKFTGKERDAESGLDDFGARYYTSAFGRFVSPDWSILPEPVPYANLTNPQTLNLYAMVRDNPETFADLDGHCQDGDNACSNVKVEAKVDQKPKVVQNQKLKDVNGKAVTKATGVEGKIIDTVKVNGQPASGVKVTESNQSSDTKNGQAVSSTLVQGKGTTNADGQIGDNIGIYHPTDGSKADNNSIKQDFTKNEWTSTDTQVLTLTLPGGQSCSATSTRTLTNAGTDGSPSSKYTLTTTQPVVTPNN